MTYRSVDKINDILAEICFYVGEIPHDIDSETRSSLIQTHKLAWELVELTLGEVEP
tara:strand:- start:618 stop:785 length:168 start_codon:yes stop_codon:yes gene_type:complete